MSLFVSDTTIGNVYALRFSHPKWQTPEEQQLIAEGELSNWVLDKLGGYNIIEVGIIAACRVIRSNGPSKCACHALMTGNLQGCCVHAACPCRSRQSTLALTMQPLQQTPFPGTPLLASGALVL
jgi:hypothetical protein